MRILITNDDGISAVGLKILKDVATQIAGTDGEVWTVAPSTEQSGASHCVSFVRPFLITKVSDREFSVEGTPADCVLAGIYDVMDSKKPDLILSGINRGNNSGENALYSGTIGAVIEASLHGIMGIALSQYFGSENNSLENPFEAAQSFALKTVKTVLSCNNHSTKDYPLYYNINFPPCPASAVVGMRASAQGMRAKGTFHTFAANSPSYRRFLWISSGHQDIAGQLGTDITDNLKRYISITPMRADMTAYDSMDKLRKQLSWLS